MALVVGAKTGGGAGSVSCIVSDSNRTPLQLLSVFGQRMGLEIVDHLQLVLHVAKKHVGGGQVIPFLFGHQFAADKPGQ